MKNLSKNFQVIKSKHSNVECVLIILHSVFILLISKYLTLHRKKKKKDSIHFFSAFNEKVPDTLKSIAVV